MAHLSALSRYRRFREPVDHFSPRELDELTHADHRTREALVALDPVAGEGISIAGYVRDAHGSLRSGSHLPSHRRLAAPGAGDGAARAARRPGAGGRAPTLRATTLVASDDARRLLAHVADPVSEHREGGIVEVTAQLRSSGAHS